MPGGCFYFFVGGNRRLTYGVRHLGVLDGRLDQVSERVAGLPHLNDVTVAVVVRY